MFTDGQEQDWRELYDRAVTKARLSHNVMYFYPCCWRIRGKVTKGNKAQLIEWAHEEPGISMFKILGNKGREKELQNLKDYLLKTANQQFTDVEHQGMPRPEFNSAGCHLNTIWQDQTVTKIDSLGIRVMQTEENYRTECSNIDTQSMKINELVDEVNRLKDQIEELKEFVNKKLGGLSQEKLQSEAATDAMLGKRDGCQFSSDSEDMKQAQCSQQKGESMKAFVCEETHNN